MKPIPYDAEQRSIVLPRQRLFRDLEKKTRLRNGLNEGNTKVGMGGGKRVFRAYRLHCGTCDRVVRCRV